jgi:hypothetical protein
MRPTTKRPTSQSPKFTPVPTSMKRVSIPMPVDVDLSCMEWQPAPEPELPVAVAFFRRAVTEPLTERLSGTLSNDGGAL